MSELSEFFIQTSGQPYRVSVGTDIVARRAMNADAVWIVDANVAKLHSHVVPLTYISQEAIESAKNLESVANLVEQMRDHGSTRKTQLFAVGGGIVQDLATFSASCYMRGIRWIYCPTTLLSMVDSCIGGKSSINVGRYKNIAGNFYPPEAVVIDARFCETLSDDQLAEGLCEAVKICYADSDESFDTYLAIAQGGVQPPRDGRITQLIVHSLTTKKRFIEEDEFDNGIRLLLNFGHTFGHAIEGATHYAISHGIAVGLGMLAAEFCSSRLGYLASGQTNVVKLITYVRDLLRTVPKLGEKLSALNPSDALECFMSDKKHSSDAYTLILFNHQGRLQRVQVARSEVTDAHILKTFEYLKDLSYEIQ